ncbi:zinc finger protein 658B-like isoform X2 [Topomyia yanbarensis]|uniref:zinc finger protein 658B-like isoform X2 n=1 Tax=Topomyia yanbarensis TaxID=2498891 RepID=UPI00273B2F04|nr:zinc finger protein 658B-like isoform X2 [Topomyia yanbarensis]
MSPKPNQDLCRICYSLAVTYVPLSKTVNGNTLADMLRHCVNLEIDESDDLPYQCCTECKSDLEVAYKMVIRCHESDTKFREQLMQFNLNPGLLLTDDSKPWIADTIKTEVIADDEIMPDECIYAEPLFDVQSTLDVKPTVKKETETNYDTDNSNGKTVNCNKEKAVDTDEKPKRKKQKLSGPKRCCRCKQKLSTMEEVREHSKTVHLSMKVTDPARIEARPYECGICFKRYTTKKALGLHKQQLYIENQHKCDQCEADFKSEASLNAHKETHTADVVQQYSNRKGQQPRCCACYEQFESDEQLKQHANEIHLPETLAIEDTNNQYQCDLCYRRYKNVRILREHQLKPYRLQQYQCSTCGRIFRDKGAVADHERSHLNERAYVCPVCAKPFVMKDSYRKHVKAHSLAEDRFKCDICGKGFKTKANLKGHFITHNPQHRPIHCTLCPSTFARKVCLQAHMKLHTGEKPYKCDQCDAAYTFSTDLKRHIMAHQGLKPYVCTICGRGYPRKDYLRKHMANHNAQG